MFRTQETLEHGCSEIDDCVASFEDVGIQDRSMVWNTDLVETLELENLLTNAAVTMHSAEARKVSLQPLWDHDPSVAPIQSMLYSVAFQASLGGFWVTSALRCMNFGMNAVRYYVAVRGSNVKVLSLHPSSGGGLVSLRTLVGLKPLEVTWAPWLSAVPHPSSLLQCH